MILKVWRLEWEAWFTRRDTRLAVGFLVLATLGFGLVLRGLLASNLAPDAVSLVTGADHPRGSSPA